MRTEPTDPKTRTLLVEHEDRAIGYAQLRHRPLPAEAPMPEGEAELPRLYLDRPWHGRGVADLVLARVADLATELGAGFIWGELHHDRVMVSDVSALSDHDERRRDPGGDPAAS